MIVARWCRRDRDRVANDDGVVADENLLDQEPHDPLTFVNVEGLRR